MQVLTTPGSASDIAETLRSSAAGGHAVQTGGAFTKTRWGGPLAPSDVRISTAALTRVLEYEPRDLTISVEAGMPFSKLTALLDANRQMVPLDPPYAANATVGGVLAANHSGPRRRLYGTARDLVIGMRFATMEGKIVQSGGMVVKNVAGLDMSKLLIGSWGTLGVIVSVNFKLIPQDRVTRTFLLTFPTGAAALAERSRILQSVLQPAAVDLLNPAATARIGRKEWLLAIGTGGSQALVDRYSRELQAAEQLDGEAETAFWASIHGFAEAFLSEFPNGAIVRASTALQDMTAVVESHEGPVVARAANGVAYLYHPQSPASLPKLSGFWPAPGAHYLMEAGPDSRPADAMWPDPGTEFPVMESIKRMMDPQQLLNKGRLYGRI